MQRFIEAVRPRLSFKITRVMMQTSEEMWSMTPGLHKNNFFRREMSVKEKPSLYRTPFELEIAAHY